MSDYFKVIGVDPKRKYLDIEHEETGAKGRLYVDSINIHDFREPNTLILKAEIEIDIETKTVNFSVLPDSRFLISQLSKVMPPQNKPTSSDSWSLEASDRKLLSALDIKDPEEQRKKILPLVSVLVNPEDELLALHTLLFESPLGMMEMSTVMRMASRGADLADRLNKDTLAAQFLAREALATTQDAITQDLDNWYQIQITNRTGVPLLTEKERQRRASGLKSAFENVDRLESKAMSLVPGNSPLPIVVSIIGDMLTIHGTLAGHYRGLRKAANMELPDVAEERALDHYFSKAKDLLSDGRNKALRAYIFYNMANQIRYLDRFDEAQLLLEEARTLAIEARDEALIAAIKTLSASVRRRRP